MKITLETPIHQHEIRNLCKFAQAGDVTRLLEALEAREQAVQLREDAAAAREAALRVEQRRDTWRLQAEAEESPRFEIRRVPNTRDESKGSELVALFVPGPRWDGEPDHMLASAQPYPDASAPTKWIITYHGHNNIRHPTLTTPEDAEAFFKAAAPWLVCFEQLTRELCLRNVLDGRETA